MNRDAPDHQAARRWLDGELNGVATVGFAWTVILAFLRLATKRGLFPKPLALADALGVVRAWLGRSNAVVVQPTPDHLTVLARLLTDVGTGGNLVVDAHLAALALEHDAELASFDADFSRFDGLTWRRPSAG